MYMYTQVLLDSEKRLEGTISTTIDGEAKMRQKALSQLRESIWNEVGVSPHEVCHNF